MDLALAHFVAGKFAEKGRQARSVAIGVAVASVPHGEGDAAGRGRPEEAPAQRPGPRQQADRRHGHGRCRARSRRASCCSTASFPQCDVDRSPGPPPRPSAFRRSACRSSPTRPSRGTWRRFSAAHGDDRGKPVRPTHVLFNGGVFKADAVPQPAAGGAWPTGAGRRAAARRWPASTTSITPWPAARPTTAGPSSTAACGFAAARPARTTSASRPSGLAIPGAPRPLRALCVVPFGMEEGTERRRALAARSAWSSASRPRSASSARPSASTTSRATCWPAGPTTSWPKPTRSKPLLPPRRGDRRRLRPVRFHSQITELGVFELWCQSTKSAQPLEAGVQRAEGRGS